MFAGIDFYSDTITRPTRAMRQAMAEAEVGDEQKREDPTTLRLEERMATLLGKTGAMFFPSATLANEIAIRLQCSPGDELIAAEDCHLYFAEAGGPAIHSAVICKAIPTASGIFSGDDVRRQYRWPKGPHYPVSRLVSVENTTNMGGGVAWSKAQLQDVVSAAQELRLKLHMDGSRLFNAAVATALSPREIADGFDTVTVCFSKGLGCPTGAILAFDNVQWDTVRRLKQLFGGAMRQSGILAAACLYALDHHVERLAEDHANARRLAELLSTIGALEVESRAPSSNMVFFRWRSTACGDREFLDRCVAQGVRFSHVGANRFRAVTHMDVSAADVEQAANIVREICG
ncbi:MAG: low specificity L-threonine aldolase [Pirellulales bacterium]